MHCLEAAHSFVAGGSWPRWGAPQRVAIVAFDSVEAAPKWYESPGHVEATKLFHQAATGRSFIVEGISR